MNFEDRKKAADYLVAVRKHLLPLRPLNAPLKHCEFGRVSGLVRLGAITQHAADTHLHDLGINWGIVGALSHDTTTTGDTTK